MTEAQQLVALFEDALTKTVGPRAYRTIRDAVNEAAKMPELRKQLNEAQWMYEGLRR